MPIDVGSKSTRVERRRTIGRAPVLAAMAWGGLIAATSSTVILPHDFFAWLAAHVFRDEASLRRFGVFWGYSWFAIVKGWHAAEFAILFRLILWAVDRLRPGSSRWNLAAAAILAALFAMSDEYHQTFVPGRGGTWKDVGIDCLGIALAAGFVWLRRPTPQNGPGRRYEP